MARLPRDISGRDLARALRRYGYEVTRESGSHMRLTTQQDNMPPPAQPPGPNAGTSLLGPISLEATRGNN